MSRVSVREREVRERGREGERDVVRRLGAGARGCRTQARALGRVVRAREPALSLPEIPALIAAYPHGPLYQNKMAARVSGTAT